MNTNLDTMTRGVLAGDRAQFTALVKRHHGALLRLARAICPSRAVADEVVQETWLAVLDGLAGFEGRSSLKTWIFRILVNRARTRATRERRSIPLSALAADDAEPPDPTVQLSSWGFWSQAPRAWQGPEGQLLGKELAAVLEAELEQLPPAQRAVVVMRDVEGLPAEDVCNVLELTETNQRVLLHRGRTRLRAALDGYYSKGAR
jgi:RNA polymerase sigma-70 factor, ECF subfamily